ncbi:unnamed protein product, partial [Rotaria socialis]
MPIEGTNLENLLERALISTSLHLQSSTTPPLHSSTDTSSRSVNKINVKPKEYNGTSEENVIT